MEDRALSEGYVKLYRTLLNHPVFKDRELLQVFVYCLLKANHKPGAVIINRKQVHLQRGQFIFGLERASAELNMSMWKLRSSLSFLTSCDILTRKTTSKYSVITVCNYNYYQDSYYKKPQATPQANHKQTTTNNNDKNEKNLKIECNDFERLEAFLFSLPEYQSFSLEAKELILEFINKVRASNKTRTIQGGRVCELVDQFRAIQGRTDPESLLIGLKKVFKKLQKHGFDFKKRDPTGYVRSVALSQKAQGDRERLASPALEEREMIRSGPEGETFRQLKTLMGGDHHEEEEKKETLPI